MPAAPESPAVRREKRTLYWRALQAKARLFLRRPGALRFYLTFYGRNLKTRDIQATLVSYPKSGRTWLERMLIEAARAQYALEQDYPTIQDLARAHGDLPRILFTHAGSSWEGEKIRTASEIAALRPADHAFGRVALLCRDPRDVLVSSYHHLVNRTGVRGLTPQRMIDSPVIGLGKIIAVLNLWAGHVSTLGEDGLLLRYEAMKADPAGVLRQVAAFVGLEAEEPAIRQAVERCRFERMREREAAGEFNTPRLAPADPANPQSFKVRQGQVGQFQSFFSAAQIEEINAIIAHDLDPVLGYGPAAEKARP